jgi:predicted O-methyltransferase YrrM
MHLEIAIVNYNTDYYLHNLLVSIRSMLPADALQAVHVWDNGSTDRSHALLDTFGAQVPWLRVHKSPRNVQHGPALDALLRDRCTADWVLLLDSDTEIIRDFLKELPTAGAADAPPAFVGQIHPRMPHLYAYLAHLLVQRPWYLELPAFCQHGAPAIDYFQAIERLQVPYRRFRWCDYVTHFGQGTLREIQARGETSHQFYHFACEEVRATPDSAARQMRGAEMRISLDCFLAEAGRPASAEVPEGVTPTDAPLPSQTSDCGRAPRRHGPLTHERRAAPTGAAPPGLGVRPGRQATRRNAAPLRQRTVSLWRMVATPRLEQTITRAGRIGLVQRREEIRQLARVVSTLEPARLLEIGTAHGGSLYIWTRVASPSACLISLDLPPWERDDPWEPVVVERLRRFARGNQRVHAVRMDSHRPEAREEVEALLGGNSLDFLFIDGDRSYDGVKQDVLDFAPRVRPGGLIALHDIHPHSKGWGGNVPRFWKEFAISRRTVEIVEDPAQDGFGIGLLWM